ncbi:tryptophan-rich protein TspO-like [Bolinopsis microptera]|uniref:tryptophan-rich protein TspO-like n=1 Tax=Bolinopsis microptera TaxID=2820187 RepID=UPI00307AD04A
MGKVSMMDKFRSLSRKEILINVAGLAGFLLLCMGGGGVIGGVVMAKDFGDDSPWYRNLKKPCFNPPNEVFAPVWSILYLLMAISGWAVWTKTGFTKRPAPLIFFFVQLLLNFVWPFLFGTAKQLFAAFVEIVILWVLIVITIFLFNSVKGRRWTHILLLPYLGWVTFASILNWNLYNLNKDNPAVDIGWVVSD